MTTPPTSHAARRLQCLEVWGGNHPVDTAVATPGLSAFVFSRPVSDSPAGGDLHYLSSCSAGQITRILLADVAGHGPSVAHTATQLRSLMRKYVNFHDQRRLIAAINRSFIPLTPAGRFATALLLTYDADRRDLSFSNAGHPLPLHYNHATRSWSYITPASSPDDTATTNIPLGIDSARYEQSPITTAPGDLVLCYTDGLIESRTPAGALLGRDGLLDLLQSLDPSTPAIFLRSLAHAVASLHPTNTTHDDVTLLLLSPDPTSPAPNFAKRLLAPLRYTAYLLGLHHPPG